MILILEPNTSLESVDYRTLAGQLDRLPGIQYRVHREVGAEVTLTEIYLIGNTAALTVEQMQVLPSVQKVVRVSKPIASWVGTSRATTAPHRSTTTTFASARTA
jgi:3-deoxy-7-phosphoheptulonate synthase